MSTPSVPGFWDSAAESFDEQPDHGLADSRVRAAWVARLETWLPSPPSDVADLGCGTGSLSRLLARHGHRVVGVDFSRSMIHQARAKITAAGLDVRLVIGDVAAPPLRRARFDVVLTRHVLWALPDPAAALSWWAGLVRPGGRLVLVEGRWQSSAAAEEALPWAGGVTAGTLVETLRPLVAEIRVEPLTEPDLWGRAITDERYAVIATV
ncbi:class I SAM-dependent methyltransferase [Actinophytocola sp.]|uniref:class I SAM-dependent methyltransferase n=1 Tax=Actinophytocola sp. TaxID=1872138 RepID=UPI002D7FCBA3|nr:class I SAM-dependent methyltransferase [Actinophytocola sp.]HET9143780.1 class I SAM-dependent methyltransferase [Actinophytocola sp.]